MNKHYKEGLIDQHGLESIIDTVGHICDRKAGFLIHVYQDRAEAKWWGEKAGKLGKV